MQHYTNTLFDTFGNAISGASVTVYAAGTTTESTLYTDNGITPGDNPITTGADGSYDFYAANGRYDLLFTHPGFTFTSADTTGIVLLDLAGETSGTAAGSGYTRITPNLCLAASNTQANWTATINAPPTAQFIDSNIPSGAQVILRLHFKALSNNAVAIRSMNTIFYTDVGGLTQVCETKFSAYEHVGVAAGTLLAEGEDTVILPISATGYVYAIDSVVEANGNAFIDKVTVVGYYD